MNCTFLKCWMILLFLFALSCIRQSNNYIKMISMIVYYRMRKVYQKLRLFHIPLLMILAAASLFSLAWGFSSFLASSSFIMLNWVLISSWMKKQLQTILGLFWTSDGHMSGWPRLKNKACCPKTINIQTD